MTRDRTLLAAAAVATLGLPLVLTTSQLSVFLLVCLATIVGCGLTLLVGFAGQVSLGHAAFYAIGAYTAASVIVIEIIGPTSSRAASIAAR